MRIRRNFAERTRTRNSEEAARKYFLVFEGDETEVRYFDGINNIKNKLNINSLIEIRQILRSYNENGWTNPKKILDRVLAYIDEEQRDILTVDSLANKVVDYLIEEKAFSRTVYTPQVIYTMITDWFFNSLGLEREDIISDVDKGINEVVRCLKREAKIVKNIGNISEYIQVQNITYEKGFDKICLIVDRDKNSFVSHTENNQFEYVKNKCEKHGVGFYLTNPCFEFWLLLHFDEVFDYDKKVLAENPKVTNKVRYLESELRKFLPGYRKSDIKFNLLKNRIRKAIDNEKHFCEDIDGLKDNVGSNVGLLLKELRGFGG